MAFVEAGLDRPNWLARWVQEHLRVLLFSLGKIARTPLAAMLTALVIGIALALPAFAGVASGKDHRFALLLKAPSHFSDAGGFADAIDADGQNHEWPCAADVQWHRDGLQHLS